MIAAISAPIEHCWRLVNELESEYPAHIGCVSAPLLDPRHHNEPFAYNISLMAIPPSVKHIPFTSSVPGLGPVAVGRLHPPQRARDLRPPPTSAFSEEVVKPSNE